MSLWGVWLQSEPAPFTHHFYEARETLQCWVFHIQAWEEGFIPVSGTSLTVMLQTLKPIDRTIKNVEMKGKYLLLHNINHLSLSVEIFSLHCSIALIQMNTGIEHKVFPTLIPHCSSSSFLIFGSPSAISSSLSCVELSFPSLLSQQSFPFCPFTFLDFAIHI